MKNRLLLVTLRLLAHLPLLALQLLGALVGWLFYLVPNRQRRVATINIDLCFPDLSAPERRRLLRRSLIEGGKSLLEMPAVWLGDPARWAARIDPGDAWEGVQRLLDEGRGVLFAAPHLGNWEAGAHFLASRAPFTTLYRPARQPWLDELILEGRSRGGTVAVPITTQGIKQLYGALQQGGMVAILPDQQPKVQGRSAGVFVPFFGVPALTMVLLGRIARKTGAPVVFLFMQRLPWGRGYRMRPLIAEPEVAAADPEVSAAALNRGVEQCVRLCPEQYQWSYKRFEARPDGGRSPYKRPAR